MGLFDELLDYQNLMKNEQNELSGVMPAIIKENYDEKHKGMVKVEFLMGKQGKKLSQWVRVMAPYAGKEYGQYMLPEVGSEVLVAFILGNPNWPVVIGSLWNDVDVHPKNTVDKKNTYKVIRTKGGSEIRFDDTENKQQITVTTPKGLSIHLDDHKNQIIVSDKDQKINMTMDGQQQKVTISAKKEIDLKIDGKDAIKITGQGVKVSSGTVALEASQSMKVKGQAVDVSGSRINVNASGQLSLQSSAIAQLKGSMVKIN